MTLTRQRNSEGLGLGGDGRAERLARMNDPPANFQFGVSIRVPRLTRF
jgi:hypothetical protein